MANLYDYLSWRGDLSLAQDSFNEVDYLILSCLAYVPWERIVSAPGEMQALSLSDAAAEFFASHPEAGKAEDIHSINVAVSAAALLKRAAGLPRYRDLRLCAFINEINTEEEKQFSALTYLYGETAIVAFRGTDTTIVGWKEDCFLALSEAVPAQLAAVEYLCANPALQQKRILLCGHSKGGNLAVYAACKSPREIAARIEEIYNFDGPGFPLSFIQGQDYIRMLPRIQTIIPKSSVVGLLLEHREKHQIVKSAHVSVWQHLPVYWEVLGPAFLREKELSATSILLDKTLKEWLQKLNDEEKRQYIRMLFSLLEATGATRLEELGEDALGGMIRALRALTGLKPEEKNMLLRAALLLIQAGNQALYESISAPGAELLRQGQQIIRDLLDKIRDGADKLLGWEEDDK